MDPQDTEDKPAFCIRVKLIQTNHRSIDLFFHLRTVSVSYDGDTVLSTNRNCKVLVFDDVQWNCVINAIQYGYLLWVWHTTWLWSNWKRVWHTTWLWSNWKRVWHTTSFSSNWKRVWHTTWFSSDKKGVSCHMVLLWEWGKQLVLKCKWSAPYGAVPPNRQR